MTYAIIGTGLVGATLPNQQLVDRTWLLPSVRFDTLE